MNFRPGDKVIDIYGGLGLGTVIDTYTNYHDDPRGVLLVICNFDPKEDGEAEEAICDRSPDQIVPFSVVAPGDVGISASN